MNQATILIATAEAETLFGVTADLVMTPVLARGGGLVCFETVDCFSWGDYSGSATLPSASGSAFGPACGLPLDWAVRRDISAGSPTLLEASDDTGDSSDDFALSVPTPRNNADETGSTADAGTVTGIVSR